MSELKQYNVVLVRQLLRSLDEYGSWGVNQRPPQVGDIGAIVEILQAPGLRDCYVVESVAKNGKTIWLDDFWAEELEQVVKESNQITNAALPESATQDNKRSRAPSP